jgi:glycosyltransferase involved in cell wall biosynthesis
MKLSKKHISTIKKFLKNTLFSGLFCFTYLSALVFAGRIFSKNLPSKLMFPDIAENCSAKEADTLDLCSPVDDVVVVEMTPGARRLPEIDKSKERGAFGPEGFLPECLPAFSRGRRIREVGGTSAPKVSIVVPIYNSEKWLDECISSLSNQTIKDIEIICVNDGSTDHSADIIADHAQKDPRIRVITQKNQGVAAARNRGLELARGEFVAFVDSDDFVDSDCYKKAYIDATNTEADITAFGYNIFNSNGVKRRHTLRKIQYDDALEAWFSERGGRPFIWNKLFRKAFLEETGVKFEKGISFNEDVFFQFRVFARAKKVAFIPDKLYFYRTENKKSLSRGTDAFKKLSFNLRGYRVVIDDWKTLENTKKYKSNLFKATLNSTIRRLRDINEKQKIFACTETAKLLNDDFFTGVNPRALGADVQNKLAQIEKSSTVPFNF